MSKKTSIYIADRLTRFADEHSADTLSGLINATAARYEVMCRRSLPALSHDEWGALFEAIGQGGPGAHPEPEAIASYLIGNIADFGARQTRWDVDSSALVQRIAALPYAAQVAVLDAVERFWSSQDATIESVTSVTG